MNLPQVRGRLLRTRDRRCLIAVTCLLCGGEHRYDRGPLRDPDVQALLEQGYTDEWVPCQLDLPGNWSRVLLPRRGARRGGVPDRAR